MNIREKYQRKQTYTRYPISRFGLTLKYSCEMPSWWVTVAVWRTEKRTGWTNLTSASSLQHRMAILEEGLSIEKIGVSPEDAQFIELRAFQVRDIARIFRIPAHMLSDMDRGAAFASVEQLGLEFVIYTLMIVILIVRPQGLFARAR